MHRMTKSFTTGRFRMRIWVEIMLTHKASHKEQIMSARENQGVCNG